MTASAGHPGQTADAIARIAEEAARVRTSVLARSPASTRQAVEGAIASLDEMVEQARYSSLPAGVTASAASLPSFAPALAATLLARAPARFRDLPAGPGLVAEFERQARRILAACLDPASDSWRLDDDLVQKDLGLCRLEMFACRAQVVETWCEFPLRRLLQQPFRTIRRSAAHLAEHGLRRRPYFEIHTHTPMLDGFNEAGWEQCYRLVADLLRARPLWLGMIGSSWFYDPQLDAVSPRLAYLRATPLEGGAFLLRNGASAKDIELATATSSTRRDLHAAGRYQPVNHTLVWPRRDLLAWADAHPAPEAERIAA